MLPPRGFCRESGANLSTLAASPGILGKFWPFLSPFFASVAVKAESSSPKFCRESDISGRKQRETVKAACHANFWGSAAIYTNCLFNFSRLPWHLGPNFGPSWAHFSPLWLSKQKLAAQNFAENPILRAGSRGRMEFAENPGSEGRKTRNQRAPTGKKMWNSTQAHPAS